MTTSYKRAVPERDLQIYGLHFGAASIIHHHSCPPCRVLYPPPRQSRYWFIPNKRRSTRKSEHGHAAVHGRCCRREVGLGAEVERRYPSIRIHRNQFTVWRNACACPITRSNHKDTCPITRSNHKDNVSCNVSCTAQSEELSVRIEHVEELAGRSAPIGLC